MELEEMSREQLIGLIREMQSYMDSVIVFWGDKKEFLETFKGIAANEGDEYTSEESACAKTIIEKDGAFDDFLELLRDSFDRGGINYAISEKINSIMEEVAGRHT
jgi:hypothetical protein